MAWSELEGIVEKGSPREAGGHGQERREAGVSQKFGGMTRDGGRQSNRGARLGSLVRNEGASSEIQRHGKK